MTAVRGFTFRELAEQYERRAEEAQATATGFRDLAAAALAMAAKEAETAERLEAAVAAGELSVGAAIKARRLLGIGR